MNKAFIVIAAVLAGGCAHNPPTPPVCPPAPPKVDQLILEVNPELLRPPPKLKEL